ncbi:MAG: hypothetical protein PHE10_05460, partial [Kiritimatiellae bacterium]|nr:hypothetical protein [Kiritimatiellia bacterium]
MAKRVNPEDCRLELDLRLRVGFVRSCVMLGLLRDEPKVRREVPERVLGLADNDEAAPAVGRRLTIEGRGTRLGATLVVAGTGRPERGAAAGAEGGLRGG